MKLVFSFFLFSFILGSVFAQNIEYKISSINFEGLSKTKEFVVSNEVNLKVGSILLENQIDSILIENATQLYNLQLFHWVKYKFSINEDEINIQFLFQERWYLWPIPIFSLADRNISSWIQNWDFNRIDYGAHIEHKNFRGKNEKIKTNIQLGYNQKYELFYTIPYLNLKQKLGLNLGISHYRSHFSMFELSNGIPQYKEFKNDYAIKNTYLRSTIFRRKNVNNSFLLNIEYHNLKIKDSIFQVNSSFFNEKKHSDFLILEYSQIINKRNTFSYPKKGYFLEYKLNQRIGLNSEKLKSTTGILNASIYKPLHTKVFFASGISTQYQYNKQNYFLDQKILGYKTYVRGYEYYVTQGNAMFLHKNSLNLSLVDNKMIKINLLESAKFNTIPISIYFSVFGDWAFVNSNFNDKNNILANQFQFGTGIGLHLVTYYDKVLVLEYSRNRMGNSGFFISNKFPF